ncbi:nucleotide sugar dehydrogenase [Sphingobacterium sp. FBM7-1]|uniref:nucleotide sugar dehydrogenase n=1 Tax=Sphingobacterium sp. FBM7-1 TaxID=2886688 RepID=UPI001D121D7D|nr:nucleotide sugar dehydrogenase [Sphingobacterium sp. FBM7-1]MCC2599997.1 nucleotide sugar dehydrogenase [Sphingobacterium sp. FBM7-1]
MKKIAVIGQGYVGLPLAIEFARHFPVVGFDINEERVRELAQGIDRTHEADTDRLRNVLLETAGVNKEPQRLRLATVNGTEGELSFNPLQNAPGLSFSSNVKAIQDAQIYIVTVPTPIDRLNAPDLSPLKKASEMLGHIIKPGDIVIYESTVYPGCTEEECVPVLEKASGLVFNRDFFVGYSPERINPGDKVHTLTTIIKVTSGSTPEVADEVDQLYKTIVTAGTHKAPSIKVAEASKAIENAQRDVNISFVNELALIFDRMGIDTHDVLEAAGTKFNFLKYKPGLVGGHCISIDPYYLTHKATQLGYHPEVISSGRRVNNSIPAFIASKVVKLMLSKDIAVRRASVLILGITFKENCPDIRNTKVVEIYRELKEYGMDIDVYDPWASREEVYAEYGILMKEEEIVGEAPFNEEQYDAIILATAHREFSNIDIRAIKKENSVVFDTKGIWPREWVDTRL